MGCSSGKTCDLKLSQQLQIEVNGISQEYLISDCPQLVASLWDITDKDSDEFTLYIIEHILESRQQQKRKDLVQCIRQARKRCKLKTLNGIAFITYGIPCSV